MEYKYALFKYNVYDSSYFFIPVGELPSSGFSSLYLITESEAQALGENGFAAYKGTVWSPDLWIDEDTEQGAIQTERRLREIGAAFCVYTTGNRGKHFLVSRAATPSHTLPQKDKELVSSISMTADLSIYTALHLFRLAGTKHEKTGERKKLLYSVDGATINHLVNIPTTAVPKEWIEAEESLFMDPHIMNYTVPASNGGRNASLVKLAVALRHRGESEEFIARWLYHTNLLYSDPVPQVEMDKIVDWLRGID